MALYSYSQLETFKHCPRKFFYRYVAKLKLAEVPKFIAPFLGSRVHDALEQIYARVGQGIVPSESETLDCYRRRWTAEWTDGVVIPDGAGSRIVYPAFASSTEIIAKTIATNVNERTVADS
jgi:hypothetical protein